MTNVHVVYIQYIQFNFGITAELHSHYLLNKIFKYNKELAYPINIIYKIYNMEIKYYLINE